MALNKYAAIRYRIIDSCIRSRSNPYPSKETLRSACEEALYGSSNGEHISISTIEKDLWTLRNESTFGYAPIVYDKIRKGYYYTDPGFSIQLPFTHEDISLIRMALQTLSHFRNSQLFRDLEVTVSKLQGRLQLAGSWREEEHNSLIVFETAPEFKGAHLLPVILNAIRNYEELGFFYQPHVDPIPREYRFYPYLLKEYKNFWYVVGKEIATGKIRTLGLDRITELKVTDRIFTPDPDFDPVQYFKYSLGIGTYSGIPEKIVLKFNLVQGKYIESQPLHTTQKIISRTSGAITLSIFVIPSTELIMQLLSYGQDVTVLEPASLRQEVMTRLKQAISNYQRTS